MKILVLNAGSSSLKYQLFDMDTEKAIAKGVVDRIGIKNSAIIHTANGVKTEIFKNLPTHTEAFDLVLSTLVDKNIGVIESIKDINAIGHRVVHGGDYFNKSVLVTPQTKKKMEEHISLAPLHMPANMSCIDSCLKLMPNLPEVAVFDTSFHQTIPEKAFMYALPYDMYKNMKVRRYGFHGTSHKYVTNEAISYMGRKNLKIINCHLGNGASISAVLNGECIECSMGLTPLEGLMMGTRSGDLDTAAITYVESYIANENAKNNIKKEITTEDITNFLNKKCGLLGIAGVSDARDLEALAIGENLNLNNKEDLEKQRRAKLALDMFAYRVKKYIGSFAVALGGVDIVVFTGGIGENSYKARERIMENMEFLNLELDKAKNNNQHNGNILEINTKNSKSKILVIPTNEELVIARDTLEVINESK